MTGAPARRPIVLASIGYYLPGFLAGGPVRSLANMVERLSDEFDFRVVTADRDWKATASYPGIRAGRWRRVGPAEVLYMDPRRMTFGAWRRLLRDTPHDLLYLNSFHSPPYTIRPLLLRQAGIGPRPPIVLAPRGELSPGALALKWRKKQLQLAVFTRLGVCRDVLWHATGPNEAADVARWFGTRARVAVAPNISLAGAADLPASPCPKQPGALRVAFVSRIQRKKNLDGVLRILRGASGDVELNVYGPREDPAYWEECRRLAGMLPPNVRLRDHGALPPDGVGEAFRANHLLFLPTRGENFGHVILEALAAGCPVLLSDQTPWRGLAARGVGWDLPLERPELFRRAIASCVAMDGAQHAAMSARAAAFARERRADGDQATRLLFRRALGQAEAGPPARAATGRINPSCATLTTSRPSRV